METSVPDLPATGKKLTDFGQKIGGARKDRSGRTAAPEDKFFAEGKRKLLREDVWPTPDYAAMVAEGVPPLTAYLRKFIRDQVANQPYPETNWVNHDKFDLFERGVAVMRRLTDQVQGPDDVIAGEFSLRVRTALAEAFPELRQIDIGWGVKLLHSRKGEETLFGGRDAISIYGNSLGREKVAEMAKHIQMFDWPNPRDPVWGKVENVGYRVKKFDETGIELEWGNRRTWRPDRKFENFEAMRNWFYEKYPKLKPASERTEEEKKAEIEEIPHLAKIVRADLPSWRTEDYHVTPQDFLDTFGVRGVEFGNWLPDAERQEVLDRAFDSMMDLCAVLEWEPQELSLGGRLALAFGSRGHGGKRAALAHFEPGNFVMNMTRMRGAGSFAHEFFHAWDCHMGSLAGRTVDDPYATENDGVWDNPRNRQGSQGTLQTAQIAMRTLRNVLVYKPDEKTGELTRNGTDFYYAAARLDRKRSKKYWSTGRELCARAFAAWTEDRLREQGGVNQYLCHSTRLHEGTNEKTTGVYPQGPLRQAISERFLDAARKSRHFVLPPPTIPAEIALEAADNGLAAEPAHAYLPGDGGQAAMQGTTL